jgi:hypothetical protein
VALDHVQALDEHLAGLAVDPQDLAVRGFGELDPLPLCVEARCLDLPRRDCPQDVGLAGAAGAVRRRELLFDRGREGLDRRVALLLLDEQGPVRERGEVDRVALDLGRRNGRDERLTDVAGEVIKKVFV